jgi:hypothetical protein
VLDIGGVPLLLRGTTADGAAALEQLFGGLPATPEAPRGQVVYGRRRVAVPRRPPDESYADLDVWHEGRELYLASEHHRLAARADATDAVIAGAGGSVLGLRRMLQPVFTHLLAWQGHYVLHAAAVRREGAGYLVLGESGQGKSTLALAALEHGWDVLADDLVSVSETGGEVVLRGVPKPLALPGDLEARALSGATGIDGDWRNRRHLAADRLDRRAVPLAAVVVVAHGQTPASAVRTLDASDVTRLVFSAFMSTPDALLLRRYFGVGAAVARAPVREVRHGSDPTTRLVEAARALEIVHAGVQEGRGQ